jgi:SAM-dependent methyltransferase
MDSDPIALRRAAGAAETATANRTWWDAEAVDYYAEHGAFLGDDDLVWGPEGWSEEFLGLLGEVVGRDVLEIGGGAAQGGRWARQAGARVVSSDLSLGMLQRAGDRRRARVVAPPPRPVRRARPPVR